MTQRQTFLLTSIAVLAVLAGVYFLSVKKNQPTEASAVATSTPTDTATATSTSGVSVKTPSFMKPVAFAASVSPELRTQITASIAKVQAELQKNPLNFRAWVDLGTYRKMGGDYAGAEEAWKFIANAYEGSASAIPHYNLGDLYQNFLKDYPKAEEQYLLAVKFNPHNIQAYASLYTMYKNQYKVGTGAAADIIKKGLEANPGDNYLLSLQQEQ